MLSEGAPLPPPEPGVDGVRGGVPLRGLPSMAAVPRAYASSSPALDNMWPQGPRIYWVAMSTGSMHIPVAMGWGHRLRITRGSTWCVWEHVSNLLPSFSPLRANHRLRIGAPAQFDVQTMDPRITAMRSMAYDLRQRL